MPIGLELNPARFEVQVLGQEPMKRVLPAEDSFLVRGPHGEDDIQVLGQELKIKKPSISEGFF